MYRGANIPGSSSVEKASPSKARENLVEITDKVRFGKKRPVFLLKGGKDPIIAFLRACRVCFSPQGRQGHCRNCAH